MTRRIHTETSTTARALLVLGALLLGLAGTIVATPRASSASAVEFDAAAGGSTQASSAPPAASCSDVESWSDERLAMGTIAVPVGESNVGDVTSEVSAGAGGVVLFGADAPADLGAGLTALEDRVPGHLGLLVMTDEEGGGIQRMANLVGSLPWPSWMGAHWTKTEIEAAVEAVGQKMAAANVNMDLSPVVDVDGTDTAPSATDPDGWRSFSGNTAIVARDGLAYMRGLLSAGVVPVLKHFPGLGGASGDTDDAPAHTLPWGKLQKVALPPFIEGIRNGAPAIMVSNATVPGLASYPASLSPAVISHELKGTLGFRGLVLTDSLSAKAISGAGFTVPEAAVQALVAGADLVLFGPTDNAGATASQTSAVESAIVAAVTSGHLSRSRLIGAVEAVLVAHHVTLCQ